MSRKIRKRKNNRRKIIVRRVVAVLSALLVVGLLLSVGVVFAIVGELPDLEKQASHASIQTSKVYAVDGTLITTFHAEQNRVIIPLSNIPLSIRHAAIAIEDERFYQHKGVDAEAILRAVYVNLKSGRIVEGASTITQQYIRNAYITQEKTLERKIKEAVLAYQAELKYNKNEILEKYLNTVYFGQGCYGIETAAETFFGKNAKDLTLAESALLAGVIKSPNHYSPYKNPQRAKERRDLVLKRMAEQKYITQEEMEEAIATEIEIKEITEKSYPGAYFVEYVKQLLINKYGVNMVFKGGLQIYTTLDLEMQKTAEEIPKKILNKEKDPSTALVAIEPKTGCIKALVGGKDFGEEKFNLAVQGKGRQAGSAFKTFVLVAAIEKGISLSKTYESGPVTFNIPGSKRWHVENYTEGSGGPPMTLLAATARSVNCVYARLIMEVGAERVVDAAHRMGITSPLDPYPSIALGAQEVLPLEMASAYATLANNGIHCEPLAILKIVDANGNIMEKNSVKRTKALEPTVAYIATQALQKVITSGTGTRANIGRPAAGKTGTAQNYQDAWFCGYTPDLSCAVWVGYPKGQIPMRNVHGIRVTGGSFPAQIWARFMSKALEDTPRTRFAVPSKGLVRITICSESGLLPTPFCTNTASALFARGAVPTIKCPIHQGITVPRLIGLSVNEAVQKLTELGLLVNKIYEYNAIIPQDEVFRQEPSEGAKVAPNSTVTIVISINSGLPPAEETVTTSSP